MDTGCAGPTALHSHPTRLAGKPLAGRQGSGSLAAPSQPCPPKMEWRAAFQSLWKLPGAQHIGVAYGDAAPIADGPGLSLPGEARFQITDPTARSSTPPRNCLRQALSLRWLSPVWGHLVHERHAPPGTERTLCPGSRGRLRVCSPAGLPPRAHLVWTVSRPFCLPLRLPGAWPQRGPCPSGG